MDAQETKIYKTLIITCILLAVIMGLFAWSIIRSQKRRFQSAGEEFEGEINFLEEKNRIARDLHDELGPQLWMCKILLQRYMKKTEVRDGELLSLADNIDKLAEGFKRISLNLMPPALVKNGLTGAIKDFIVQCSESHEIEFEMKLEPVRKLPLNVTVHIVRIVQELVLNSVKHAEASKIIIRLAEIKNKLQLVCADNGKGFYTDEEKEGSGIENVKDRSMILGGTMHCSSGSRGTTYVFIIPVGKWKK